MALDVSWKDVASDESYKRLDIPGRIKARGRYIVDAKSDAVSNGINPSEVEQAIISYSLEIDPSLGNSGPGPVAAPSQRPIAQQPVQGQYNVQQIPGQKPSRFNVGWRYIDKEGRVAQLQPDGKWRLHEAEYEVDEGLNVGAFAKSLLPWNAVQDGPTFSAKEGEEREVTETFTNTYPTGEVLGSFKPVKTMNQFLTTATGTTTQDDTAMSMVFGAGLGIAGKAFYAARAGIAFNAARVGAVEGASVATLGLSDLAGGVMSKAGSLGKNLFKDSVGAVAKKRAAFEVAEQVAKDVDLINGSYNKVLDDVASGKTQGLIDPVTKEAISPDQQATQQLADLYYGGEKTQFRDPAVEVINGRFDVGNGDARTAFVKNTEVGPTLRIPNAEVVAARDAMTRLDDILKAQKLKGRDRTASLNVMSTDRVYDALDPEGNGLRKMFHESPKAMIRIGQGRAMAEVNIIDDMAKALSITGRQADEIGAAMIALKPGGLAQLKKNNPKTYNAFQFKLEGIRDARKQAEFLNASFPEEQPLESGFNILSSFLTKEQMAFAKFQKALFDKHAVLQNMSRRMSGLQPMGEVEHYFPHMVDYNQAVDGISKSTINPGAGGAHAVDEAIFQQAKERTGGFDQPFLTNAVEATKRYVEHSNKSSAINPFLHKLRTMQEGFEYTNPATGALDKFSIAKESPALDDYLTLVHNDLAGVPDPMGITIIGKKLGPKWRKTLNAFRRNMTYNYLSFVPRTAIVQLSAMVPAVAEIGAPAMAKGIKMAMRPRLHKFARDNAADLLIRIPEDALGKISRSMGPDAPAIAKLADLRDTVGDAGMIPVAMLDKYTATAVWLGTYDKAKRMGLSGRKLFNAADSAVRRTQASPAGFDVSRLQREGVLKPLLLFQTFALNQFDQIWRDIAGAGAGARMYDVFGRKMTGKRRAVQAGSLVAGMLLTGHVANKLGINSPFPDPVGVALDENVKGPAQVAGRLAQEGGEIVPGGSSFSYGSNPLGPGIDFFGDLAVDVSRGNIPEIARKAAGVGLGITVRGPEKLLNTIGFKSGLWKPTKKQK